MPHLPPKVLFGAAYYHEYQRGEHLETDLDLMADAGFSVIRVGESVWSTWEPENGQFNLDWLQPVLDGAHRRGIGVILGTPTYAVPPWLARQYPEIAGERSSGRPIPWGARQEMDFTHPAFRFHAERVIRRIVGRYAGHPAIIGYQVDNEPGVHLLHNRGVFQRFTDHLRRTYGSVEKLNEEWGLVYWSHRLSDWADLWLPDGNAQPQYDLAWRRFQAELTAEFIAWQAAIVREYATPAAFITTCLAYDRQAFDDAKLAESLDVATGNAYYVMQDGLAVPDNRTVTQTWTTRPAGKGRVTYVGTVPGVCFAQAILRWACAGRRSAWTGLPASVTSSESRSTSPNSVSRNVRRPDRPVKRAGRARPQTAGGRASALALPELSTGNRRCCRGRDSRTRGNPAW